MKTQKKKKQEVKVVKKRRKKPKTQKIKVELPPKMSSEDALFIAYYYVYEMKGTYPFIISENGRLTEFPGELFKHFTRNMLGLKNGRMETQIIECLRMFTKSQIIKKTCTNFQVLKRRKNVEKRVLFLYNKMASIKNSWNKREFTTVEVIMDKQENVENKLDKVESMVEDSRVEQPKYKNIADYTADTGKRFRIEKKQKARGLTREQAFTEFMEK